MWVLTKLLTKTIPHTFVRNGYYYFSRRVPSDLRDHYSYHRIVQGLRTASPQKAKVQASITSAKLEAYWNQVRLAKSDVIKVSYRIKIYESPVCKQSPGKQNHYLSIIFKTHCRLPVNTPQEQYVF